MSAQPEAAGSAAHDMTSVAHDAAGRHLAGWRAIAEKEFADHVLSLRFVVLLGLLGLAAVAAVYAAASGIRDAAPQASADPSLFLRLFTIAPERVPPFFVLIGLLAPLLGIAFGFDAVNGERAGGTLPRLLAQPIHRDDVVNGKFAAGLAAIGFVLAGVTLVVAGFGMVRLGIVPSPEEVIRILLWLAVAVIYAAFWLAFATLCSVAFRRAATAAFVAIAAWLVLTLFATLLVGIAADAIVPAGTSVQSTIDNAQLQLTLARISPSTLYEEATTMLLNPDVRTVGIVLPIQVDRAVASTLSLEQSLLQVWPQAVGLLALTVLCFAAAYLLFLRQEVRA
jgi:ABC-2 type transport system permease protein